jgi:methyl-accepting chemotaxis protein
MSSITAKRRKALVDPEVQGGILRKIAVHWVVFFVCNALALMIWIRLFEQPDVGWSQTFGDTVRRFLPFFIITLALIPAFVWDTLKLTNRFAGPILRLRSALKDASAGRAVVPLHFRSNDFWKEIAQNFNSVIDRCDLPKSEHTSEDQDN